MSELLTTGEMVDRLKVGETAVGDVRELGTEIRVFKDKVGHIKFDDSRKLLELSAGIVGSVKWRILPTYVSFEEAMKALKDGKEVELHNDDGHEAFINRALWDEPIDELTISNFSFKDLLNGKWTIEED